MTKWIDVLWGGGLTQSGIKPASSKDLRSHISIMSVAVQRCVDGCVAKRLSFVPGHLRDGSLHVSVGPGYDNVELVAILTLVEGIRRLNITAQKTHIMTVVDGGSSQPVPGSWDGLRSKKMLIPKQPLMLSQ